MKILITYDKNTAISNVLDKGVQRAKDSNASIYLVSTCLTDGSGEEIAEVEAQLEELKRDIFEKQNIPCESHILTRSVMPGEELVSYAKEKGVDEIIIGLKKPSKLGKIMFGSTAQYIILEASCPVLCVK